MQKLTSDRAIALVRIGGPPDAQDDARQLSLIGKAQAAARSWLLFIVIVVAPTLVVGFYYFALAANRYESEVEFVVRSPSGGGLSALGSLMQTTGSVVRSSDDAFIVESFLTSRDAMDYLVQNAALLDVLNRPEADFLSRYPNPISRNSQDNLYRHYLRLVTADYEKSTGVMRLRVEGFRPLDAQAVALKLVEQAEKFVNKLNDRASADAISSALTQVQNAETRAKSALEDLAAFRKRVKIIDPQQASIASFTAITTLSLSIAENNAMLASLAKETPGSPHVSGLKSKIDSLQDQITAERQKLAGGENSLASLTLDYEKLMLTQTFAEKAFLGSLATLEGARVDAIKQRVFLETITSATLPDYPSGPARFRYVGFAFLICLMIWRILRTFIKDTIAHGGGG